ncbi:MAG: hypothetical protein U0105_01745 [Candidatus Obscuribacterales bacterium]
MQAEEIPSAVSYKSLLDVLQEKTLVGYSPEERVEYAHLMQCLKHLQTETEYRVLLASQVQPGVTGVPGWRQCWQSLERRCANFLQRARCLFLA